MFLSYREMSTLCCIIFIATDILHFCVTDNVWYSWYVQSQIYLTIKVWMPTNLKFEWLLIWKPVSLYLDMRLALFFFSIFWTFQLKQDYFCSLIKMHKGRQIRLCLRVWFITKTECHIHCRWLSSVTKNCPGCSLKLQGKKFHLSFVPISPYKRL